MQYKRGIISIRGTRTISLRKAEWPLWKRSAKWVASVLEIPSGCNTGSREFKLGKLRQRVTALLHAIEGETGLNGAEDISSMPASETRRLLLIFVATLLLAPAAPAAEMSI